MDINIIKEKAREYANGIHGITHKRTASVDFEKGAQFVLESMKWRNAEKRSSTIGHKSACEEFREICEYRDVGIR